MDELDEEDDADDVSIADVIILSAVLQSAI
jgi:hypothetical protein